MEQRKNIITIGANDFVQGIGLSSREGMQQVQDVDPFNIDGTLQAGFKTVNTFPDPFDITFTADSATDQLTVSGTLRYTREGTEYTATGRAIQIQANFGVMPNPLVINTTYFVIDVSEFVIKLATTYANALAGTAINITTNGSGILPMVDVRQEVIMHYATNTLNTANDSTFGQDIKGQIWEYTSSTGWHLVLGNAPDIAGTRQAYGLAVAFGYLFSFNSATVDILPLNNAIPGAWINGWTAGTGLSFGDYQSNNSHTAFLPYGQVNTMFFANTDTTNGQQPYVGSLAQIAGTTFVYTDTSTYNWNPEALQLPDYQYITDFEYIAGKLAISTIGSDIYLWDGATPTGYQGILPTLEPFVSCMKNINSVLYYGAGFRGNIYATLGTTSTKILDFSDQESNVPQTLTYVNSIADYNGYLLFSISGAAPGVYLLDISDENNRYHLKNICSNSSGIPGKIFTDWNTQVAGGNLNNTKLYEAYRYFFSWSDTFDEFSTVRGCDSNFMLTNGQWRQTDGNAYFISQLYRVADNQLPYTFDQCNLYLTEPIQNGHQVIISTRKDNLSSFSNPIVFDFNAMQSGGGVAGNLSVNVENARMFQVLVTIYIPPNTTPTTSQYVTPKIAEITFK